MKDGEDTEELVGSGKAATVESSMKRARTAHFSSTICDSGLAKIGVQIW